MYTRERAALQAIPLLGLECHGAERVVKKNTVICGEPSEKGSIFPTIFHIRKFVLQRSIWVAVDGKLWASVPASSIIYLPVNLAE
jgi:hypothetical protein